jgi:hypothetical protein
MREGEKKGMARNCWAHKGNRANIFVKDYLRRNFQKKWHFIKLSFVKLFIAGRGLMILLIALLPHVLRSITVIWAFWNVGLVQV